jgi:DNA repair photolyase
MERTILKKRALKGLMPLPLHELRRKLHEAFDEKAESHDPAVRALRAGLPVIIGRKCEPLCPEEERHRATLEALKAFREYGVKAVMETKCLIKDEEYYDLLSGILVSVMPGSRALHDRLEPGTPTFEERFELAKEAKDHGLWVGLVAEPIIPSVNDRPELFEEYARQAAKAEVNHVCFGPLRIHNVKLAYERLKQAGVSLELVAKRLRDWKRIGEAFFEVLRKYGLRASTPDWVGFPFSSDCEGCCGLDSLGLHHFTFQKALRVLKEHGRVSLKDLVHFNIFGDEALMKFREVWNPNRKYFTLSDVEGIRRIGIDSNGNAVYGFVG